MQFLLNFYRPQTKLREGNVFTHVCLSTGGVYPSMHLGRGCVTQHAPGHGSVDRGYVWMRVWTGGVYRGLCGRGCVDRGLECILFLCSISSLANKQ